MLRTQEPFFFFFLSGGVKLACKTLSADKLLYWFGHPYNFVVISDDQMTALNMVPWLYIRKTKIQQLKETFHEIINIVN